MPTYQVVMGFSNCNVTRTYEVTAETEDEAKEIVASGEAACLHEEVDTGEQDDPDEWDVQEV